MTWAKKLDDDAVAAGTPCRLRGRAIVEGVVDGEEMIGTRAAFPDVGRLRRVKAGFDVAAVVVDVSRDERGRYFITPDCRGCFVIAAAEGNAALRWSWSAVTYLRFHRRGQAGLLRRFLIESGKLAA